MRTKTMCLRISTLFILCLAMLGYQESTAQITIVNNTDCNIVLQTVQNVIGSSCQGCNQSPSLFLAANGGTQTYFPALGCGAEQWMGIKYWVQGGSSGGHYNPAVPCGANGAGSCGFGTIGGNITVNWFGNTGSAFVSLD